MLIEGFFTKKGIDLIKILFSQLKTLRTERKEQIDEIEKIFGSINLLVPYYVIPNAQNVNPADLEEDDTGLVARNNIFSLLDKFLSGSHRFSHAFVLSDAGMGKTSLLVMLKLFYLNKFIQPKFELHLFKIGPDTIEKIENIKKPHETVLLLDALDEDSGAWENFYTRLQMLLQASKNFLKVIITCRTQFFPSMHEEDGRVPGQIVLSGFHCSKIFLSPFNDEQVNEYLHKKFSDDEQRKTATKIVTQMKTLKFRPMLLSYIDFLIEYDNIYNNAYSIYKALVEEWLNRELRKGIIKNKELIRNVCFHLANYLYKNRAQRIPEEEMISICNPLDCVKDLEFMTVEGRSLLHRTSDGSYKFAHYSILEFFIATSLLKSPSMIENSDQVVSFIADQLAYNKIKKASNLNLRKIELQSFDLSSITFRDSNLTDSKFNNSKLMNTVFKNSNLTNSNFSECDFTSSNLKSALCHKAIFNESIFKNSIIENIDFTDGSLERAQIIGAKIDNSIFVKTNLSGSIISGINSQNIDFSESNFTNAQLDEVKISDAILNNVVLDSSTLQNCSFENGSFHKAQAPNCIFQNTSLKGCNFDECDIKESRFIRCDLKGAVFNELKESKAKTIVFEETSLIDINFQSTIFKNARFNKVELRNSSFSKSDIENSKIDASDIKNVKFVSLKAHNMNFTASSIEASILEDSDLGNSIFNSSEFKNSDFFKATLSNSIFNDITITKSNFTGSNLRETKFINCKIIDAKLNNTNLQNAKFENCKIINTDFSGSNIKDLSMVDCDLINTSWINTIYSKKTILPKSIELTKNTGIGPGAVLEHKNFKDTVLDTVDLSDSILKNTNFRNSSIERCNFENARLIDCDLSNTKLNNSIFLNAEIERCQFSNSLFNGAILRWKIFTKSKIEGAVYSKETKFPKNFEPSKHGLILKESI